MQGESQGVRARKYLLGAMSDEDAAVVEQEYFSDAGALDRLSAAEDELIEDYLETRLEGVEHDQFTRAYLAAPHRRRRVETVRRLMAAASRGTGPVGAPAIRLQWLATAAAILAVIGIGWFVWRINSAPADQKTPVQAADSPLPLPIPQAFTVSISPTTVRSASAVPSVVIPVGTEVVILNLEGEINQRVAAGRAAVRTVSGDDVWQGPIALEAVLPDGVIAAVRVPASRLPEDDYVLTLFAKRSDGTEREVYRYFVRVRAR